MSEVCIRCATSITNQDWNVLFISSEPVREGEGQNTAAVIGSVVTVLLVAALVVTVIVLIRYSGDSRTGSRAGSGCYCPHHI